MLLMLPLPIILILPHRPILLTLSIPFKYCNDDGAVTIDDIYPI